MKITKAYFESAWKKSITFLQTDLPISLRVEFYMSQTVNETWRVDSFKGLCRVNPGSDAAPLYAKPNWWIKYANERRLSQFGTAVLGAAKVRQSLSNFCRP